MPRATTAPIITVITAQQLTADQVKEVEQLILRRAGEVKLEFSVDPSILGGIQVKIGNQSFDASLEGQLQRLQLAHNHCLVTTAVPLTPAQRQLLAKSLMQKYGTVAIEETVDPKVIGGIRVVIGSQEYDRTVAGRLSKLHQQTSAS